MSSMFLWSGDRYFYGSYVQCNFAQVSIPIILRILIYLKLLCLCEINRYFKLIKQCYTRQKRSYHRWNRQRLIGKENMTQYKFWPKCFTALPPDRVANSLLSQELKLCFSDTKFTKAPYTKKDTRFFIDTKWDTEQYQILSHTKIFWWY